MLCFRFFLGKWNVRDSYFQPCNTWGGQWWNESYSLFKDDLGTTQALSHSSTCAYINHSLSLNPGATLDNEVHRLAGPWTTTVGRHHPYFLGGLAQQYSWNAVLNPPEKCPYYDTKNRMSFQVYSTTWLKIFAKYTKHFHLIYSKKRLHIDLEQYVQNILICFTEIFPLIPSIDFENNISCVQCIKLETFHPPMF